MARNNRIFVKMTAEEKERLVRKAKERNKKVSEMIREDYCSCKCAPSL